MAEQHATTCALLVRNGDCDCQLAAPGPVSDLDPAAIERAVAACFVEDDDYESLGETLGFDENYARKVVVPLILRAALAGEGGKAEQPQSEPEYCRHEGACSVRTNMFGQEVCDR